jgi:hypothetical protein
MITFDDVLMYSAFAWEDIKWLICCSIRRHAAGSCQYSGKEHEENLCKFAHSSDELDEWNERWTYRQSRKDEAKNLKLYSYMEMLMEEYHKTMSGVNVV